MKFFAVAAAFVAAVSAQYSALPTEECSAIVTVTETVTLPYGQHTPVAPGTTPATQAPYPTTEVSPELPSGTGYPPAPPAGTGYPAPPAGTGYPVVPAPSGTGAPAPSGTGAYTSTYPEFTGAASSLNVGGFVAGVGAVAALFL
ncbi:hypothetical protein K458DRAFT_384277 [Lentithecium fluviatile CBS 122367]|uniref:Uncharacterized protein n=1 Tax=Lentithecium fluviatile CBS 122367 TaxID=1168545 RepID=A0A6G1JGP8_9PLEO|nr:hypothetical protein K458DRAFT_384277 [Lentithecium fluviatile CBS 122367]